MNPSDKLRFERSLRAVMAQYTDTDLTRDGIALWWEALSDAGEIDTVTAALVACTKKFKTRFKPAHVLDELAAEAEAAAWRRPSSGVDQEAVRCIAAACQLFDNPTWQPEPGATFAVDLPALVSRTRKAYNDGLAMGETEYRERRYAMSAMWEAICAQLFQSEFKRDAWSG